MINETDKRIIEKAIHRELRNDEWNRLMKSEWNDVYNWIVCHTENRRNN